MDVAGRAVVGSRAEAVFDAIEDPAVLLELIPGCEAVERAPGDEYHARFALRMPGLAGSYDAVVRLIRAERPTFGELEGRVEGRAGGVAGRATFELAAAGPDRTVVDYRATAVVTGPLARLDGRFVEGLVRSLVAEGLERLGRRLATEAARPDGGAAGTEAADTEAADAAPAGASR